jgi:arylsulfatase
MSEQRRPNILLICTDQQRYDSLGCYGNPYVQTPIIDQLAAEGVLFEHCYVQSPVCAPSRASLVTGRYPHNHGLWANGVALPAHEEFFTRALADGGYDCGMIGKLHLAACFNGRTEPRLDDGLRYFQWAHDPSQGSPQNMYHRWLEEHHPELYVQAVENRAKRQAQGVTFDTMPTEAHYSRWVGDKSVEFLTSARDQEKPFFLWANFYDPHHAFVAPQEYLDRYIAAELPRPIGKEGELALKPAILTEASAESYAGHARGFTSYSAEEIQEVIAAYYAMVTLIDDEVKRILETLAALGLAEDTLVIFTSDHGEMLGDHRLILKGPMMYEGAVRVPLILRWPGHLPAGERRPELVQWIDLNPTMLEAAGLPPLPRNQGQSLLPLARGDKGAPARDWALCEYRNNGHPYDSPVHTSMLRHRQFKLVVYHGEPATQRSRTGELYDLEADPQEVTNLWTHPAYLETRTHMQERLLDVLVATEERSQPREAYW